jgi:anaphase-promoting complex subunit 11
MMRYTTPSSSTGTGNSSRTNTSQTSRKRRNETSELFTSPSQENENIMNHPSATTTATSANNDDNVATTIMPTIGTTATATAVSAQSVAMNDSSTTTKVQVKVRIQRYHSVAHWTWGSNTKDDVCSICQNAFEGVCPGVKYPGEDCPVVWGKCLHAFHLQCINTWLTSALPNATNSSSTKNSCPICRQEWEFSSSNPSTTTVTIGN